MTKNLNRLLNDWPRNESETIKIPISRTIGNREGSSGGRQPFGGANETLYLN